MAAEEGWLHYWLEKQLYLSWRNSFLYSSYKVAICLVMMYVHEILDAVDTLCIILLHQNDCMICLRQLCMV